MANIQNLDNIHCWQGCGRLQILFQEIKQQLFCTTVQKPSDFSSRVPGTRFPWEFRTWILKMETRTLSGAHSAFNLNMLLSGNQANVLVKHKRVSSVILAACALLFLIKREKEGEKQQEGRRSLVPLQAHYAPAPTPSFTGISHLIPSPQQAQAHGHPLFVEKKTDSGQPWDLTYSDRCVQGGSEQRSHSVVHVEEKLILTRVVLVE